MFHGLKRALLADGDPAAHSSHGAMKHRLYSENMLFLICDHAGQHLSLL